MKKIQSVTPTHDCRQPQIPDLCFMGAFGHQRSICRIDSGRAIGYPKWRNIRLSTVAGADQIYVIENSQIAESGKSRELLEKGGIFSRIWQDYQTSVLWTVAKEGQ